MMRRTLFYIAIALPCVAREPWKMPPSQWSETDAQVLLYSSPWAKRLSQANVTVRWESARPVQLALQKLNLPRILADGHLWYAITVLGLKDVHQARVSDAWLKVAGRPAVAPAGVKQGSGAVLFLFPRTAEAAEPIVFRLPFGLKLQNTVEFHAHIGDAVVRQKFSLHAMSFEGAPAL